MSQVTCVVVTPEATVLQESADFVAAPLGDGELGVAPGRTPLIGRLGFGELRLRSATGTRRFYIDGGFVQVADDTVTVLTNRAIPAERIDVEAARKQLAEAASRAPTTTEAFELRDRLVAQARAQLRVAQGR